MKKLPSKSYGSWHMMKQRCFNSNNQDYEHYGGRGITVCEEWFDFKNFLRDMGERPGGHSIERIDNDGNYEPGNCHWITQSEQLRNRRKYTIYRKYSEDEFVNAVKTSLSIREIVRKLDLSISGTNYATVKKRIKELSLDTTHFM